MGPVVVTKGYDTFEDAVARQADRVAALEAPSREDLMALLPQDLAGA